MTSFPKKEERTRCYAARDEYWKCLDEHHQKVGETITTETCAQFKALFEKQCPPQWVSHFVRKYDYLKFKEKIDSGYEPIVDDNSGTK